MSALSRGLEPLRRARWPILVTLVVVPAVAVAVALIRPAEYRSEATIGFSGRNTGHVESDVRQARLAVRRDRSLALRTLDVTGVTSMTARQLQDAVQLETRPGRLEIALNRASAKEARILADEFGYQLARDQRARIVSSAVAASEVVPRPLQTGLLGLALAVPLAALLATWLEALRRRESREP